MNYWFLSAAAAGPLWNIPWVLRRGRDSYAVCLAREKKVRGLLFPRICLSGRGLPELVEKGGERGIRFLSLAPQHPGERETDTDLIYVWDQQKGGNLGGTLRKKGWKKSRERARKPSVNPLFNCGHNLMLKQRLWPINSGSQRIPMKF